MANERKWLGASALLSANGTVDGVVIVTSTRGFKVKAKVTLKSNTQTNKEFEIKAVYGNTIIHVGPLSANIEDRSDVSAFLLADSAQIVQYPQKRPTISREDIEKAIYEEEPTVARRVIWVDEFGDKYTESNPVPVQLSDGSINIGTVNAELEVQLSHKDNVPNVGDVADSVQIGDGTEILAINPDGSINVVASFNNTNTPTISNFAVILANTEYSYTFPLATKQFSINDRAGDAKTRIAYSAGATSTVYKTINMGNTYEVNNLSTLTGFTIYFQSNKSGRTLEIVSWK